jgi:hypothetical protein
MSDETQMTREECERVLHALDACSRGETGPPSWQQMRDALRATLAREKAARDAAPSVHDLIAREGIEPRNACEGPVLIAAALLEVASAIRAIKSESSR